MKIFANYSNKRSVFILTVFVTISIFESYAARFRRDVPAAAAVEEEEEPVNTKKEKPKAKKEVVSSHRGNKSVQRTLKTESMIAAAMMKPENVHISSTLHESAKGKLTMESADSLTGSDQWHNFCGCGGTLCETKTECARSGFEPFCCGNKCKCVKVAKFELEDYWKKLDRATSCRILGCENSAKPTCYDVSPSEFNCWQHKFYGEDMLDSEGNLILSEEQKLRGKDAVQYAYFGCTYMD